MSSETLVRPCVAALVIAALACVPRAGAQTSGVLTLGPRTAELSEPFSVVQAVRELRDGRVIVADARDRLVWIGDFSTGKVTQFSRQGSGPGEYTSASGLFAGPGDSTMLVDMGNRRLVLIDPAGRPAGERSLSTTASIGGRQLFVRTPEFADARGVLYSLAMPVARPGGVLSAMDSMFVVRLTANGVDSIARFGMPPSKPRAQSNPDGSVWTFSGPNPLDASDGWAVAPDGRVAIVRAADYHVDWFARGGRVSGRPVPITRLPVRDADKADVMSPANQKQGSFSMNGATTTSSLPTPRFDDWPAHLPPFRSRSPRVSPDGRLWVERYRTAGDSVPVFDVFDAAGNASAQLTLPRRTRLIGFGNGTLYIVRIDEDDLQHLERYRLPTPAS